MRLKQKQLKKSFFTKSKNNYNKKSNVKKFVFGLLILSNLLVSCIGEPKLGEKEMEFCENYFIALQVREIVNNEVDEASSFLGNLTSSLAITSHESFQAIVQLLGHIRQNGNNDVIHAFLLSKNFSDTEKKGYVKNAMDKLGINGQVKVVDNDAALFFGGESTKTWNDIFEYIYKESYNSKLKEPQLKSTFVEKLDNGTIIWLIEDYMSMQQIRLLVKENGEMNIDNLESFSNY